MLIVYRFCDDSEPLLGVSFQFSTRESGKESTGPADNTTPECKACICS